MGKGTLAQAVILENLYRASLQVQAILLEVSYYEVKKVDNVGYERTTIGD